MSNTINTRIKLKRDTSANWTTNNPVLLNGEQILVDTADGELRVKVGDGTKTYTQLPFTDEVLRSLINEKANTEHIHSYADLTDKPTIPTVGNGTIIIKQGGASKGTFTTNQNENTIIELTDSDTTYSNATTSAAGLMSASDKTKLDTITENADSVSYTPSATSGNKVGTITINGSDTDIYSPVQTTVETSENTSAITGIILSGDGSAYTATVSGISSLTAGVSFIMIPHTVSTSQAPTLNVNGLGAKNIRRRISNSTTTTTVGYNASWLAANKPVLVTYDGTYWIADIMCPNAADMYGTLAITKGGTGATTAEDALQELGAVSKAGDTMTGALVAGGTQDISIAQVRNIILTTTDPGTGVSVSYPDGTVVIVYE